MRSEVQQILRNIKWLLRPITSRIRKKINIPLRKLQVKYLRGVGSTSKDHPGGMVLINNSSGGFLIRLLELASRHSTLASDLLIVSEPENVSGILQEFIVNRFAVKPKSISQLENLIAVEWTSGIFNYDLCKYPANLKIQNKFDVIFHQSVLEHVIDPVSTIHNLNDLLKPNGIQVIQTCNVFQYEHKFPIDTLRFFPDFFKNLSNYIPVKCEEVFMEAGSIYAVLRKI
jgi:SAM-dependent methyltransferase